mgnify:CR=1 FL=1
MEPRLSSTDAPTCFLLTLMFAYATYRDVGEWAMWAWSLL